MHASRNHRKDFFRQHDGMTCKHPRHAKSLLQYQSLKQAAQPIKKEDRSHRYNEIREKGTRFTLLETCKHPRQAKSNSLKQAATPIKREQKQEDTSHRYNEIREKGTRFTLLEAANSFAIRRGCWVAFNSDDKIFDPELGVARMFPSFPSSAIPESSCGYLLQELKLIWDEVGQDQLEREKILLELEQECIDMYRRKVTSANILSPEKLTGTLKQQLDAITPALHEMQLRKEERMNQQFREVHAQIQRIASEIAGHQPDCNVLVIEGDLSLKKLDEHQNELQRLHKEKTPESRRLHKRVVQNPAEIMAMDASMIIGDIHPSLLAIQNISDTILEGLKSKVEQLKDEKRKRTEKSEVMIDERKGLSTGISIFACTEEGFVISEKDPMGGGPILRVLQVWTSVAQQILAWNGGHRQHYRNWRHKVKDRGAPSQGLNQHPEPQAQEEKHAGEGATKQEREEVRRSHEREETRGEERRKVDKIGEAKREEHRSGEESEHEETKEERR
ncbi:Microtubule associated protein (MAP65/ASE1 family), partial [Musa troglodytarum]